MSAFSSLPLFLLNTVLFPGMPLPLHIFEPRYRLMIQRCDALNQPFGVVLIERGAEVGGPATPHTVGTSAEIISLDKLPDGRMNIQTLGQKRFRIREIEQSEPFMVALVEDYPVQGQGDPVAEEEAKRLRPELRDYISMLIRASESGANFGVLPSEAMPLAFYAASMVPFPNKDKQSILEAETLFEMLDLERRMLRRELTLLRHLIQSRGGTRVHKGVPFSSN